MRNLNYCFMVLDIETSTIYRKKEINNQMVEHPIATWLAYSWIKVYDIKGNVKDKFYFREWYDLRNYLYTIVERFPYYKIICYVHNLSFEFDYIIKNISKPKTILSNSTHDVITATLEDYPSIEFRCTYQLTGHSLAKIGEQVGLPKLESDYRTIYPCDEPTKEEIEYCERDCDIVAKYIVDVSLKEYGNLFNIPYTKTGRVRKVFNEFYNKYSKDCKWDLMPDEDCYEAMLNSFQGGICISNPLFTNCILKNVHSYDIKSSYPFVSLAEKYPYTIRKITNENLTEDLLEEKFWIAKIKFNNISSKYNWQWLSVSKMQDFDENAKFFNGKLINADYIVRTLTNIDYEIIKETYYFSDIEILEFYRMDDYDYLPKPYIETIKIFSVKKDELKNLLKKDSENLDLQREYMLAKNDFNSIYGMSVQKLMNPEFEIDEHFVWREKKKEYKKDPKKHMKRNFLFGIYITAYARRNLIRAIIKNCPLTFVYADTDSIKFIGENIFIDTNARLTGEFSEIKSLKNLGEFEYECTYEKFKTLGAKKYAYEIDGICKLTVAGLPKSIKPLKSILDFKIGTNFDKCKLGKMYINTNYYFDIDDTIDEKPIINVFYDEEIQRFYDENDIISNGGVALYPTSYYLDMTNVDKFLIKMYRKDFELWRKNIKQQIGIDLTDYCLMMCHLDA